MIVLLNFNLESKYNKLFKSIQIEREALFQFNLSSNKIKSEQKYLFALYYWITLIIVNHY